MKVSHQRSTNPRMASVTATCLLRGMLVRVCCLIPVTCAVYTAPAGHRRLPIIRCSPRASQIHIQPSPSFGVGSSGDSRQEFRERSVQQSFYSSDPSTLGCRVQVLCEAALSYSSLSPGTPSYLLPPSQEQWPPLPLQTKDGNAQLLLSALGCFTILFESPETLITAFYKIAISH